MADGRPRYIFAVLALMIICTTGSSNAAQQYLGKFLGKLSELHHGVSGEIYAVDARTLHLKDFTYDGEGPAAYFWAGSSRTPGSSGFRVRDENGNDGVLKRYRRKSITLTLPDGKNLNNIKWFSVWCDEFAVNFGDVKIPRNFDYPKPQKIEALRGVHGVSSDNIVIVDAQTLLIPNFSYDGEAPDAKFWVGHSSKPSPQGIRVPDENGKEVPLRRYDRKTVVLTLPGELTIFDIGHFGVWCEAFTVDFGHVRIPANLNVPPSLKMLGVSPQSKLNCEVINDDLAFEVRWAVAGESIVLQLIAKLDNGEYMSFGLSGDDKKTQMIGGDVVVAWVDKVTLKGYADDYFLEAKSQCSGPRGSCPDERLAENTNNIRLLNAAMVNGYSIVTYQRPLKASDELDRQIYTNQSQAIIWAVGPLNQRNEVSFHSSYLKKNHLIDFGRPAKWNCPMPESDSSSSSSQQNQGTIAVQNSEREVVQKSKTVLNEEEPKSEKNNCRGRSCDRKRGNNREVSERRRDQTTERTSSVRQSDERSSSNRRRGSNNRGSTTAAVTTEKTRTVPTPKPVTNRNAWYIPPIQCYEPDDGVFYAQMGPTGGKHGYSAITGHVGWGISWYINGLLIPEINVVRGKTYTFVTEGGLDPEVPAKYHPFYITDDPVGGYEYKTPEERQNIRIFAGVKQSRDNKVIPTGVGRLCHWTHTGDKDADDFQSFGAFQRTLELRCDVGDPGVITWTPDTNTPDTVYYQCFSHRYLGWKINVLDSCDERSEASEPEPAVALPEENLDNGDLKSSSSILVETRIKPNDLFQTTQTKLSDRDRDTERRPSSFSDSYHYDDDQRYQQVQISFKNNFQSSPELHYGHDDPFKFVDIETPPYLQDNLTTTANSSSTPSTTVTPSTTSKRPLKIYSPTKLRRPTPNSPNNNLPLAAASNTRPPFIIKPIIMSMRPPPIQGPYKKSFYRIPMRKRPAIRPISHVHQKLPRPKPAASNHEPIIIMKHQHHLMKPIASKKKPNELPTTTTQVSTSTKQEELVTETSELLSVKKENLQFTLRQAINTGFHPESIVIEKGFKPIITKEFEKRISEDEGESLNLQDELGVINLNSENQENSQQFTETFEPMFIPSPPDSHLLLSKKQNISKLNKRRPLLKKSPPVMLIVKHVARSAEPPEDDMEDGDDEIAMAAERVEAYYLPPDDKRTKPIDKVRKPSNIDIPPGSVVTFDGKTVSGDSLTAPVPEPGTFEARSSKATELLRLSPQFGPFRGEIPPLNTQNINLAGLPQLRGQAVLNRDLNAPAAGPAPGTTKLAPVKAYQNVRNRRSAHHTPEHTAEQERQRNHHDHEQHSSSLAFMSQSHNHNFIFVITISFILKYIIYN